MTQTGQKNFPQIREGSVVSFSFPKADINAHPNKEYTVEQGTTGQFSFRNEAGADIIFTTIEFEDWGGNIVSAQTGQNVQTQDADGREVVWQVLTTEGWRTVANHERFKKLGYEMRKVCGHEAKAYAMRMRIAELEGALGSIVGSAWMVQTDIYSFQEYAELCLKTARAALANKEPNNA